mgnify:CR=1 FL=1
MYEKIKREILDSLSVKELIIESCIEDIESATVAMINSIKNGGKILFCGNGGSAGDAQHMAAEFIGRFMKERKSFPAIALSADSSIVTALGNDYGFENIFSRQVESLIKKNDIIITMDSDNTHPIKIIPKMILRMKKKRSDIIIASRFLKSSKVNGLSYFRKLLSLFAKITFSLRKLTPLILSSRPLIMFL